jgi:cell division protein FtsQ
MHRRVVMGHVEKTPRRAPRTPWWKIVAFCAAALSTAAGAFVGVVYGADWLTTSDAFALSDVRVSGNAQASREEILRYLNVAPGENTLTLNLEVLKANLLRHPWIKSVEISRALPDALVVNITEHRAAGVVALGSLYLVDEDGDVFSRASAAELATFPTITGLSRELFDQDPSEWHRLLGLALSFQGAAHETQVAVGEVHVDDTLGISAQLVPGGVPASFGSGDYYGKLRRLQKTRALLVQQGKSVDAYLLDNQRHPNWVVARVSKVAAKTPIGAR